MKKVVAFSTLRQLGLLVILFATRVDILVIIHLASHALFKSALFRCVGLIIYRE